MVLAMFRFVSPDDVTSTPDPDSLNYPYRCRVHKYQSQDPLLNYILCMYMKASGPHIKCTSLKSIMVPTLQFVHFYTESELSERYIKLHDLVCVLFVLSSSRDSLFL
jgi:hypothetical protein